MGHLIADDLLWPKIAAGDQWRKLTDQLAAWDDLVVQCNADGPRATAEDLHAGYGLPRGTARALANKLIVSRTLCRWSTRTGVCWFIALTETTSPSAL